jgi:hypothetical protein
VAYTENSPSDDAENPPPLVREMFTVSKCAACLESVTFIGIVPEGAKSYFDVFGEKACKMSLLNFR